MARALNNNRPRHYYLPLLLHRHRRLRMLQRCSRCTGEMIPSHHQQRPVPLLVLFLLILHFFPLSSPLQQSLHHSRIYPLPLVRMKKQLYLVRALLLPLLTCWRGNSFLLSLITEGDHLQHRHHRHLALESSDQRRVSLDSPSSFPCVFWLWMIPRIISSCWFESWRIWAINQRRLRMGSRLWSA